METYAGRGAGAHIEKQLFSSKDYALICSPWITSEFAKRIIQMVERGTHCRVITSDKIAGDSQKSLELLSNFVKPQRDYLGRTKKDWSPPPFEYKVIAEKFVHAKMYIADGKYAVTGSANLTESGLWRNIEHIIIINNPNDVEKLEDDFQHLWEYYEAKEIVEESSGILKGLWKRIKGYEKSENDPDYEADDDSSDEHTKKVKSKRFWKKN